MSRFSDILPSSPTMIGVIHLPSLPGSPLDKGQPLEEIEALCVEEARQFERGGFDAVIVENAADGPRPKKTYPDTIASLGALTFAARKAVGIPVGASAGYDAMATLGIAAAAGAAFIRAPIYLEASITPAGIIEGMAAELLRYRKSLGNKIAIFADIYIKHTSPLSTRPIEDAFRDASTSGFADALVITGVATGQAPSPETIEPLKKMSKVPILVGSGVTPKNAGAFAKCSDGFIVGTYCKGSDGRISMDRMSELLNSSGRGR